MASSVDRFGFSNLMRAALSTLGEPAIIAPKFVLWKREASLLFWFHEDEGIDTRVCIYR
jgi:hypothetical protein